MKFKYFASLAQESFKTSSSGERLFFDIMGAFWLKAPYIIPSEETEKRLFKKQLWMVRTVFGYVVLIILVQPFLLAALPNILSATGFLIYFLTIMMSLWIVNWLVFRNELSVLKRRSKRILLSDFYRDIAKRESIFSLVLRLVVLIGLVMVTLWAVNKNLINVSDGWTAIIIGIFIFLAIMWAYIIYLKFSSRKIERL